MCKNHKPCNRVGHIIILLFLISISEIDNVSSTQEAMTHTPSPVDRPKSMNMLAEDSDSLFRPTALPSTSTNITTKPVDEPKGRALNFTVNGDHAGNVLSNTSNHHHDHDHDDFDLSDVTINEQDDFDMDMVHSKILAPKVESKNASSHGIGICEKGGLTYENGEKLEIGCDSTCTCRNGKMVCEERCSKPFFRTGKKVDDPLCSSKKAEDPCCSILVCTGDTETEPLEICTYKNKTYNRGDLFHKECSEVCTCEAAGKISCKPRCPPTNKTTDRCLELRDPNDPCCKQVLCDVTLDDNEPDKEGDKTKTKLLSAKFVNSTTILVKFDKKIDENYHSPIIEISSDQNKWENYIILPEGYVFVKDGAKYAKLENSNDVITIQSREMGSKSQEKQQSGINTCAYNGKTFKLGDEYNDNCNFLCVCKESGMSCLKLQCPTYFGVDVLDPNCVEWETIPPDFKPVAPTCCADSIRCKNNGTCDFEGRSFKNWEQLPNNVTGCEKRCYCEMGKVECQNICPPVTALPPSTLPCPPNMATISNIPDDDCCKYWVCNPADDAKAQGLNKTQSNSMTNKTKSFFGTHTSKVPSKILGPLAVYENEDKNDTKKLLGPVQKPSPEENPFYHLTAPQSPKIPKNKTYYPDQDPLFVTPPFVRPPTTHDDNNIPSGNKPHLPFSKLNEANPAESEINIHSQSSPDDILQFINQHPEISNYPSGSVLEIHNLPGNPKPPNPFGNQPGKPQIHLVPYLVPPNSGGEHSQGDLPPGFTLEQILQEFHKNTQSHKGYHPLLSHPNFAGNGPGIVPQHGGSNLPYKFNNSYSDAIHFPTPFPGFQQPPQDDISVHTLEAIDSHTVRLAFMVPRVIVGLHGRVEVKYTHTKADDDLDSWMLQIFAPPNDLIATPSLEFDLLDLKPDTEYKIKITITLRDIDNSPTSRIYKIKTPKEITATSLPPMIPIEPDLAITDINATWVTVVWRKFTEYELQFIDGVQLRFKEIEGKIYAATPLIHRAVTSYTLESLKPNTKYEIGIFLIPFSGQLTELHAENMLHFTTANLVDTYGFNVTLEVTQVKSQTVEISWNGVPYPEDKYVNIYRAIYQSDSGKEDHSTFKIAKRDSATKTVIMDLKPGTRYRIWLEVYLTNGKIKTSNVQDFITKPRNTPALAASSQQDKLSRAQHLETKGDYYGPLVIVAILAAIAILSTLVLLMILVRRHSQNKAAITPPTTRVSQSAYDNPTYKVEIQQETMGL